MADRIYRVSGGEVPVSAAVAGVTALDLPYEPYGDDQLRDDQLIEHARWELRAARLCGTPVLGRIGNGNRRVVRRRGLRGAR